MFNPLPAHGNPGQVCQGDQAPNRVMDHLAGFDGRPPPLYTLSLVIPKAEEAVRP
jgi:hypothetical protein